MATNPVQQCNGMEMHMSAVSPIELKVEELRGQIKGVQRDQKGLEELNLLRYDHIIAQHGEFKKELADTKAELKVDLTTQTGDLKKDIQGIKSSLGKYFFVALTVLAGLSSWALKTLYTMQEDTNKALIQMTMGAPANNSSTLPYLKPKGETPRVDP